MNRGICLEPLISKGSSLRLELTSVVIRMIGFRTSTGFQAKWVGSRFT